MFNLTNKKTFYNRIRIMMYIFLYTLKTKLSDNIYRISYELFHTKRDNEIIPTRFINKMNKLLVKNSRI